MAKLWSMPFGTMPRDISTHDKRKIASDSCIDIRSVIVTVKECDRPRNNGLDEYSRSDWSMDEPNAIEWTLTDSSSTRR